MIESRSVDHMLGFNTIPELRKQGHRIDELTGDAWIDSKGE
ncbi:MAG: hypothetical protein ABL982_02045 [Vicinamibacterales bacterium]